MAAPFPEAQLEALIWMILGSLTTLVVVLGWQLRKLRKRLDGPQEKKEDDTTDLRTDNIGLSKRAEDVLDKILEEPELQSDLPKELEVSKATVSNAVSELKKRGLILRKKKANTYLIEPNTDELEKQQR